MGDELNKHRIPYAFLNDTRDRFLARYGAEEPLQAIAFSYNQEFSLVLAERMMYFNSDAAEHSLDNIGAVKNQLATVQENMVQNISSLLERGERLELLVEKTDHLNQQAFRFESSSRNLRRTMYWKQMRCRVGLAAAVVFLVFMASAAMCGGLDFAQCRKK
jgi:vesicle-associated membrane protein 7